MGLLDHGHVVGPVPDGEGPDPRNAYRDRNSVDIDSGGDDVILTVVVVSGGIVLMSLFSIER